MTFDEWWDTTKATSTPDTFAGWEASCRQAWYAARKHEPESAPERRGKYMTCEQCKNPSLKGIHTCNEAKPYADQYSKAQAEHIFRTISADRLGALKALLALPSHERDRVLKAIGL